MPRQGEIKKKTQVYTQQQLASICSVYSEALQKGDKMSTIFDAFISSADTVIGIVCKLLKIPTSYPSVTKVASDGKNMTKPILTGQMQVEYEILWQGYKNAVKRNHKYIEVEKHFVYREFWMHGERWDSWYDDRLLIKRTFN